MAALVGAVLIAGAASACGGRSAAVRGFGVRSCGQAARRDCTSAGTVRWSLPMSGAYILDHGGVEPADTTPQGTTPYAAADSSTLV